MALSEIICMNLDVIFASSSIPKWQSSKQSVAMLSAINAVDDSKRFENKTISCNAFNMLKFSSTDVNVPKLSQSLISYK